MRNIHYISSDVLDIETIKNVSEQNCYFII